MINPRIPIPFASSEVHHIYDIDIKNAPYIEDVIDSLYRIYDIDIFVYAYYNKKIASSNSDPRIKNTFIIIMKLKTQKKWQSI